MLGNDANTVPLLKGHGAHQPSNGPEKPLNEEIGLILFGSLVPKHISTDFFFSPLYSINLPFSISTFLEYELHMGRYFIHDCKPTSWNSLQRHHEVIEFKLWDVPSKAQDLLLYLQFCVLSLEGTSVIGWLLVPQNLNLHLPGTHEVLNKSLWNKGVSDLVLQNHSSLEYTLGNVFVETEDCGRRAQ